MKSKILIVDDEEHIRELIRFYLDKEGFSVVQAASGQEALQLLELSPNYTKESLENARKVFKSKYHPDKVYLQ